MQTGANCCPRTLFSEDLAQSKQGKLKTTQIVSVIEKVVVIVMITIEGNLQLVNVIVIVFITIFTIVICDRKNYIFNVITTSLF